MKYTLSIDPGIRGCGAALFENEALIAAAYVKNEAKKGGGPRESAYMAEAVQVWAAEKQQTLEADDQKIDAVFIADLRVDTLALEYPQTYGGRSSKGDANDLFPLAAVDGALAALFPQAKLEWCVPHAWKGSISKPANQSGEYMYAIEARVRKCLSVEEGKRVEWPRAVKPGWDVADAIGVGLHFLGRFERMRVFPRE